MEVTAIKSIQFGRDFYLAGDKFEAEGKHLKHLLDEKLIMPVEIKEDQEDVETSETVETDLAEMTVAELKEYAEKNQIDLQGATKKEDIIAAIEMF